MNSRSYVMVAILVAGLPLAACSVDVREDQPDAKHKVDIRTPIGAVSVRADVDSPDTGLRVYPGARPLRENNRDPGNADVDIGTALFGVKVVAAKFESTDVQEPILEFYRNDMKRYGAVTECKGNIDFRGSAGSKRAVCRERGSSRDVQLVAGTEERHRIVAVKPRGDGSEIALVYIQTRGSD